MIDWGAGQAPDHRAASGKEPCDGSLSETRVLAPGFTLATYKVIAVDKFPVTDPAIEDDDDRRTAAEVSTIPPKEAVRRPRDTGLFARVVNLSETEFGPGPEQTAARS